MKATRKYRRKTERLVLDAVLAALTLVLGLYLTIRVGTAIEVSLTSLPILFAAFLLGPVDALTVALVSSFLKQVILYGVGPTTVVWMLPSVLFALIAGLLALPIRKYAASAPAGIIGLTLLTVLSELIFTIATTAVIYFDAWFYQYPPKALAVLLPLRLASCALRMMVTTCCVAFLFPRIQKMMSKRNNP